MKKTALITGFTGQVGSQFVKKEIQKGFIKKQEMEKLKISQV